MRANNKKRRERRKKTCTHAGVHRHSIVIHRHNYSGFGNSRKRKEEEEKKKKKKKATANWRASSNRPEVPNAITRRFLTLTVYLIGLKSR